MRENIKYYAYNIHVSYNHSYSQHTKRLFSLISVKQCTYAKIFNQPRPRESILHISLNLRVVPYYFPVFFNSHYYFYLKLLFLYWLNFSDRCRTWIPWRLEGTKVIDTNAGKSEKSVLYYQFISLLIIRFYSYTGPSQKLKLELYWNKLNN